MEAHWSFRTRVSYSEVRWRSESKQWAPCATLSPQTWPDGEVPSAGGGTPLDVDEQVLSMDVFDWSMGIQIRQQRVRAMETSTEEGAANDCIAAFVGDYCIPELEKLSFYDTAPFGRNWTHPGEELTNPWRHKTVAQLGAAPAIRGKPSRLADFDGAGFAAVILPFFSEIYLPEQRGPAAEVIEFRNHYANRFDDRNYVYQCVRLSWNGDHLHQLCDPVAVGAGPTTGLIRAAVEDFLADMSRAHFLDLQTRVLSVHMPLRSNHYGIRARLNLIVEFSSSGLAESAHPSGQHNAAVDYRFPDVPRRACDLESGALGGGRVGG